MQKYNFFLSSKYAMSLEQSKIEIDVDYVKNVVAKAD